MLPSLRTMLSGVCVAILLSVAAIPGLLSREIAVQSPQRPALGPSAEQPDGASPALMAYARRTEELQRLSASPFDDEIILRGMTTPAQAIERRFLNASPAEQSEVAVALQSEPQMAPPVSDVAAISVSVPQSVALSVIAASPPEAAPVDAGPQQAQPEVAVAARAVADEAAIAIEQHEIVQNPRPSEEVSDSGSVRTKAGAAAPPKKSASRKAVRVAEKHVRKKVRRPVVTRRATTQTVAVGPNGTFTPDGGTFQSRQGTH